MYTGGLYGLMNRFSWNTQDYFAHDRPLYICFADKSLVAKQHQVSLPVHYRGSARDESRYAYTVLANLLRYVGLVYRAQDIVVSPAGKPYHAQNDYYFSYAHSFGQIVCVIGDRPLGVDIERSRPELMAIRSKVLTKQDVAQKTPLLSAWVVKEAYSKLLGVGLGLSFSRISVEAIYQKCHCVMGYTGDYRWAVCYSGRSLPLRFVKL